MKDLLLCKPGEIFLKGLNKHYFEERLVANVKRRLKPIGHFRVTYLQSALYIEAADDAADLDAAYDAVRKVFGIATITRAAACEKDKDAITALAKMFDLKYSSTKIAYGYLLRIRDDNAVLSDEYFIDAATDPIQKRYAQYERAHAAAESEQPETPPPVDTPTRRDDLTVYLLLPAAEEAALTQLLSTLEKHQSHATLLLTPELPESAGDGVRRAAATGNAVALRIDAATAAEALAQIERGNDALWHAASLRTRLVYLESADKTLRAAVVGAGYCPITINTSDFTRSGTHWADTALKWAGRSTSVRLYLGAESGVSSALGTALSRLRAENCTIAALNEVTA